MDLNDVTVKCYSGHTYAEEPRSFQWQGIEYQVGEIEKSWREPCKKCFQGRIGGSKLFQFCYNETKQRWSVAEVVRR